MRLNATRLGSVSSSRSFGDQLYDLAGERPSLDLNFAGTKTLDPRVTFTRASSATYTDSAGVLRSSVTNLLFRSEEFDNASWTKHNLQAFGSGSIVNAIAAPNGTVTADKIVENTATTQHMVYQSTTPEAGKAYVFSFYAKAAERTFVIGAFSGGGISPDCTIGVNLNTGAVVSTTGSPEFTQVTPIGDGWYRISLVKTMVSASGLQPRILMSTNGTGQSYTGDGASGLYVWGAQLEQSSTVGEYIPTTSTINSAPRFDHDPTTGESLGLLPEEARTNLIIGSELFSGALWAAGRLSVASTTATIAPDGSNNAIKMAENTVASQYHFINYAITKAASAIQYTYSVYAKAAGRELAISIANGSGGFVCRFNLANGTITLAAAAYGPGFTAQASTITPVGNGWYRCLLTGTTDATTSVTAQLSMYNTALATGVYTGDGTSGFYVWGAQLEAGAFPTSYIPTTSATVTRAADVASITGAAFSSFYNQTEGTVFAESTSAPNYNGGIHWDIGAGGSFGSTAYVNYDGTQWVLAPAASPVNMDSRATAGRSAKSAAGLAANNSVLSAVGLLGTVDTSCAVPASATTLTIGKAGWSGATSQINGTIKRLTYWPVRLQNTTLQQITQ